MIEIDKKGSKTVVSFRLSRQASIALGVSMISIAVVMILAYFGII